MMEDKEEEDTGCYYGQRVSEQLFDKPSKWRERENLGNILNESICGSSNSQCRGQNLNEYLKHCKKQQMASM